MKQPALTRGFQSLAATVAIVAALVHSERADACAGPCATPEIWSVDVLSDNVSVTTNFGLLVLQDDNWDLVCEETTPGLFLKTQLSETSRYISTTDGLVHQSAAGCDFETLSTSDQETAWLMDFALPQVDSSGAPEVFGLLYDLTGSSLRVVNGSATSPFEVVASFDTSTGYERLAAASDASSLFITGYSFNPRAFRVAVSLDGAATWEESTPEVETTASTFVPLLVHPTDPQRLMLSKQTPAGEPDELWLFDAVAGVMDQLLVLPNTATLIDVAVLDSDVFLAASDSSDDDTSIGLLYRAEVSELEFTQLQSAGPGYSCLAADEQFLYSCTNDFTRDSDFLVASSADGGETWAPILAIDDLESAGSCAAEQCEATLQWMQEVFSEEALSAAAEESSAESTDVGPTDAGSAEPDRSDEDSDGTTAAIATDSQSGCGISRSAPNTRARDPLGPPLFLACVLVCWFQRRRHFSLA